jgi:dimethylargininase
VAPKLHDGPFVGHDAGVLAGAVVLRPSTAVDRLVPLQGEPSPIAERAIEQHQILVGTLRERGVAVHVLEPVLGTPTEALVGDLAILLPAGAVIARPSAVERRAETAAIETALTDLGIPIIGRIGAPGLLDAADVTLAGETLYIGVPQSGGGLRARSNALGRSQIEAIATANGLHTIELAVAPNVLRLRNVLSFVGKDTAVVAPSRIDTARLSGLRLIELPLGEEYAAGVLALGELRVIANLRFRESLTMLRKAKIAVDAFDLWEFGKAGAGPFSLVLPIKRR